MSIWRSTASEAARVAEDLAPHVVDLRAGAAEQEPLMRLLGRSRFALLGEASHGTQEFYRERIRITQRLIADHGFTAVAVEADWPDAWRVNRYVRGVSDDRDAASALGGFQRFPSWMWRNTEVRDFVEWLREWNAQRPQHRRVGFYGLDLYSLFTSMQEVLKYLDAHDPEEARRARARYACFDHARGDSQAYGYAASYGAAPSCEDEVVAQLREMNRRAAQMLPASGLEQDELFFAQQNARLVHNAEEYYRTMFRGRVSSWNLRDSHMAETLQALDRHLASTHGVPPRIAVWAHNSHLGDASATEMGDMGEWNLGQLSRDRWGADAVLVGFSTHRGWVTAADDWDGPHRRKRVRDGLEGSWEDVFHHCVFHHCDSERALLVLRGNEPVRALAMQRRLQRAIGVIYRPETERMSHYFETKLAEQFDAMIHIDETDSLEPLDSGETHSAEAPETFPSAL